MAGVSIQIEGRKLAALRKKLFVSQAALADALDMSRDNVQRLSRPGTRGIYVDNFRKLADFVGVKPEELIEMLKPEIEDNATEQRLEFAGAVPEIPTFRVAVAAGTWTEVTEIAELHSPALIDDGRFRIFVGGDSMQPTWPDGGLVEFRCLRMLRDELEIGQDYYVQVADMATFKRLESITEDELIFRAINRKKYPKPMNALRTEIVRMARAEYLLVDPSQRRA